MEDRKTKRDVTIERHNRDRDEFQFLPPNELADELLSIITMPPDERESSKILEKLKEQFAPSAAKMSFHLPIASRSISIDGTEKWISANNHFARHCLECFELLEKSLEDNHPNRAVIMGIVGTINYYAAFEDELHNFYSELNRIDRMRAINPGIGKSSLTDDPLLEIVLKFFEEQKEQELDTSWRLMRNWLEIHLCGPTPHPEIKLSEGHLFNPSAGVGSKGVLSLIHKGKRKTFGYNAILRRRKRVIQLQE